MKLKKLIQGLDVQVKGSKETEISGIETDSRKVGFGNLYLAKRGGTFDGTEFIDQAVSAGASCVGTDIFDPFLKLPQLIHPDISKLEPALASCFYSHPSKELHVVGITGTKGKTTTSYLIKHLLEPAGLIGTIETLIKETQFYSTLTTHGATFNQKWLREMVKQGCSSAVLEVSSHGLEQARVDEIEFDQAVFTNLTPDHLDYHPTMEAYARAKKKLFDRAKNSILNADSPWAEFMGKGRTYGINSGDVVAKEIKRSPFGTEFRVENTLFKIPLIGTFNIYNALAAITVGLEKGMRLSEISDLLSTFQSVPGRLERIDNVFIDFAHSGEALKNVLETLKEIAEQRVIVVFGSGGDRDPNRRVGMGKAADEFADISIITNDNPRTEDPEQIAKQIKEAFTNHEPIIELNREKAIEKALELAGPKDLILIAGKGHERGQIFANHTLPFDDIEVVKNLKLTKEVH